MCTDPAYEGRTSVGGKIYVPRDESFDPIKEATFIDSCMRGLVHKIAPKVSNTLAETNSAQGRQFNSFDDIDRLYSSVRAAAATVPAERLSGSGAAQDVFSSAGRDFLKGATDFVRQLPFMGKSTDESDGSIDINYPLPELVSSKCDDVYILAVLLPATIVIIKILSISFRITRIDDFLVICRSHNFGTGRCHVK